MNWAETPCVRQKEIAWMPRASCAECCGVRTSKTLPMLPSVQVKGKRQPVTVYEALLPMVVEQPPDGTQLQASTGTADRYSSPGGAASGPPSVQGTPVDLHTPLIGADLVMTQVGSGLHEGDLSDLVNIWDHKATTAPTRALCVPFVPSLHMHAETSCNSCRAAYMMSKGTSQVEPRPSYIKPLLALAVPQR